MPSANLPPPASPKARKHVILGDTTVAIGDVVRRMDDDREGFVVNTNDAAQTVTLAFPDGGQVEVPLLGIYFNDWDPKHGPSGRVRPPDKKPSMQGTPVVPLTDPA